MRSALALLLLVGCSCGAVPKSASPSPPSPYATPAIQLMVESSMRLVSLCDGEPVSIGSGVAVSPTEVLTARHVAEDLGCTGEITFRAAVFTGEPVMLEVSKLSDTQDAAKLVVSSGETFRFDTYARLAARRPKIGDGVCVRGGDAPDDVRFILGDDGNVGILSLMWEEDQILKCDGNISNATRDRVVVSIHGVHGNSGAAFFSKNGEILGLLTEGDSSPDKDNWARGPAATTLRDLM